MKVNKLAHRKIYGDIVTNIYYEVHNKLGKDFIEIHNLVFWKHYNMLCHIYLKIEREISK